jgi:hypothetical protein
LERFVHEAVAAADALEEEAFGAVVEEEVVAGWGVAVVPEGRGGGRCAGRWPAHRLLRGLLRGRELEIIFELARGKLIV